MGFKMHASATAMETQSIENHVTPDVSLASSMSWEISRTHSCRFIAVQGRTQEFIKGGGLDEFRRLVHIAA